MHSLQEQIEQKALNFIKSNNLVQDNDIVVVATSGGADSIALLGFLHKVKGQLGSNIEIKASTVNHGIRAEGADRDMIHVEETCKKLGIQCITFNAKTDGTQVPKDASEEWARELRYNYFKKLPTILKAPSSRLKVATAHTASDQAETLLFRLSRNSSYKSLMGIPVKRNEYIRPFLCLKRDEIEVLCDAYGIAYMVDETNLEDVYCRNKIRHNVIPVLTSINNNAIEHLNELAEFSTKLDDYFVDKAKSISERAKNGKFKWRLEDLQGLHELELDAFINYIMEQEGVKPSKVNMQLMKELIHKKTGAVELNSKVTAAIESYGANDNIKHNLMFISDEPDVMHEKFDNRLYRILQENNVYLMNHRMRKHNILIIKTDLDGAREYIKENGTKALKNIATYETLFKQNLSLRGTDPNDAFKPACRLRNKVRKLYREMQIVPQNISKVPCIKSDVIGIEQQKLVWVYNVGFTDGFSPFNADGSITEALKQSRKPNEVYIVLGV